MHIRYGIAFVLLSVYGVGATKINQVAPVKTINTGYWTQLKEMDNNAIACLQSVSTNANNFSLVNSYSVDQNKQTESCAFSLPLKQFFTRSAIAHVLYGIATAQTAGITKILSYDQTTKKMDDCITFGFCAGGVGFNPTTDQLFCSKPATKSSLVYTMLSSQTSVLDFEFDTIHCSSKFLNANLATKRNDSFIAVYDVNERTMVNSFNAQTNTMRLDPVINVDGTAIGTTHFVDYALQENSFINIRSPRQKSDIIVSLDTGTNDGTNQLSNITFMAFDARNAHLLYAVDEGQCVTQWDIQKQAMLRRVMLPDNQRVSNIYAGLMAHLWVYADKGNTYLLDFSQK